MLAALTAAGAPADVLTAAGANAAVEPFEVFEENWETVKAFLELETCWTWLVPAMGRPIRSGIAASEIRATLEVLLPSGADLRQTFLDIRAMERAALEVFLEQA
ncbi:DUF1799 domain-containing protein [Achromobacter deleyi]|uniref:DUF1799 domain-containing protein n=1 Tax=Achromobacter deleyi TaxID=1353891 RepID=A0A7T4AZG6_9BURK|nr:DUF1799 domain-containing protein [Achromobacter deleyi]QQB32831.1 DUF1799 domain-containing protein [Achromobacter deleyi]